MFNSLLHNFFRSWYFLFLDNIEKNQEKIKYKVFNTFEIIMENGAFAPKGQMLHFP